MINPLMLLAAEANTVIALRMMKLMRGGKGARREAELMVSEKIRAAFGADGSSSTLPTRPLDVKRQSRPMARN
jgi:hypothetical protein